MNQQDEPLASPTATEGALKRRPTLAAEQLEMVRRLTQDGDGVVVVVGQAGCGKTFALGAAREAWEASGRRVYGAALARRAARELQDGAGIDSTSVAALLGELARHPFTTLRPRSVLVLDEAGMLPTRELAQLVQHASALDIKLVLVGDHRQLPSIGGGGAFRGLRDAFRSLRCARTAGRSLNGSAMRFTSSAKAPPMTRHSATTKPAGSSSETTPRSYVSGSSRTGGRLPTSTER
jgi:ATP-dependent exoDNAse (exonuclease V) alpha subunit